MIWSGISSAEAMRIPAAAGSRGNMPFLADFSPMLQKKALFGKQKLAIPLILQYIFITLWKCSRRQFRMGYPDRIRSGQRTSSTVRRDLKLKWKETGT